MTLMSKGFTVVHPEKLL